VVAARLVLLASVGLHAPAQARLHPVRIDNPEGRALTLQEVDEGTGTLVTPRRLADPQIDLMLPLGRRFWVTVHETLVCWQRGGRDMLLLLRGIDVIGPWWLTNNVDEE
jgi:hypothetical protein